MTTASHPTSDREALSALFDGELAGDAARFALKRLDHDQDWRDTCERWQVVGDVLRGTARARMPTTFPSRVREALHPPAPATTKPERSRRWGSVALAASAAVVAFFLARLPMGGEATAPTQPAAVVAATTPNVAPPTDAVAKTPGAPDRSGDPAAAQLAAASVALASATRQSTQRSARTSQRRAATPRAPVVSEAANDDVVVDLAVADVRPASPPADALAAPAKKTPFDQATVARPWPRAVLPQYSGNAALAADYQQAPSFYPFAPHPPESRTFESRAPANDDAPADAPPSP